MGSIAIVGVRDDDSRLSGPALERVGQAAFVVVPSSGGTAARLAEDAGATTVTHAELGVTPDAPGDDLVTAVRTLAERGDVVVLSPGFPIMRAGFVSRLLERVDAPVDLVPAMLSPLEVLILAFDSGLTADVDIVEAHGMRTWKPQRDCHLVVTSVDTPQLARRAGERLREVRSEDARLVVAERRPDGAFGLTTTTVGRLAASTETTGERVLYAPPTRVPPTGGFAELVRIMAILRDPDGGCPWDLAQDHMSIRGNLIEEAYEAVAAIEEGDDPALSDELGDIMLQIVFHAQMGAEAGTFTIDDAVAGIVAKLRRRHPHIFGTAKAGTPGEVLHQWEAIKRTEKPGQSVLASVPHALPALLRAHKISRKAAATGFDWETVDDVWVKVHEEIDELKAVPPGSPEAADEVGDVLFSVVNVARKLGVDSETALRVTCDRFSSRFAHMEAAATASGRNIAELTVAEMETLWQAAKQAERDARTGG